MFLDLVDETEVSKLVDTLKDCAVGWDNLPSFIFKENKNPFSKLLSHIINLSFAQGVFPCELKIANIVPIFEAGEKDIIGNYRPVSLLTTVSKVFEKAFFNVFHRSLLIIKSCATFNLASENHTLPIWQSLNY